MKYVQYVIAATAIGMFLFVLWLGASLILLPVEPVHEIKIDDKYKTGPSFEEAVFKYSREAGVNPFDQAEFQ